MARQTTYGFNEADANALIQSIEGKASVIPRQLPRGGVGSTIFTYELTTGFSTNGDGDNEAEATITRPDGALVETGATLIDAAAKLYVDDQDVGDIGDCHKFAGKYYVIQAPCEGSTGVPSGSISSTTVGATSPTVL